uniref:Uncharacterized protein n=1 Tax=Biomphalaria glabrata TaxID=6526 RepID=A0A2C9L620_BIOGL
MENENREWTKENDKEQQKRKERANKKNDKKEDKNGKCDGLNKWGVGVDTDLPEISQSLIRDKAVLLVKARLIRRCEDVILGKSGQFGVAVSEVTEPEQLFLLPTAIDFETSPGLKRPASDNMESKAKRIKLEAGEANEQEENKVHKYQGPGYWRVNVYQFHHHFRDQVIIAAVAKNIDQVSSS